jgi:hypothetical protein
MKRVKKAIFLNSINLIKILHSFHSYINVSKNLNTKVKAALKCEVKELCITKKLIVCSALHENQWL